MSEYQYNHFELQEPTPLSVARYKWSPSEIVEEVEELKRAGFNSRTRGFVDVEKQATAQCRRHRTLMEELEKQTISLLIKGELIAFGRSKDPFAGYKHIPPDSWQNTNVNFDNDTLAFEAQPESRISNIVVFDAMERPQDEEREKNGSAIKPSLKEEYVAYVRELVEANQRSSREKTYIVMQERWGEDATYGRLKPLRKKYYPSEWKRGRPKKGQNNRGDK